MIHDLKVIQPYYDELYLGTKKFELRKNDRDYKVGDILILREYNAENDTFSGSHLEKSVSFVLTDAKEFGLMDGYCILSLIDYRPFNL